MKSMILCALLLVSCPCLSCEFDKERNCDELSHEIGRIAEEMEADKIPDPAQTRYFQLRTVFDSKASLNEVEGYINRISPLMKWSLLKGNYSVAICEYRLSIEQAARLASAANRRCADDATDECFRKFYAPASTISRASERTTSN